MGRVQGQRVSQNNKTGEVPKVNDLWEVVDVRIELKVNELVRIIRQGKCRKRHSVVCLKDTVVVLKAAQGSNLGCVFSG